MDINNNMHISLLLEIYGNLLTDKQRQILTDFFDNNMSLGEIAECTNISRQAVNDMLKRGQNILQKYEDKLLLLKKFNTIKSDIVDIKKDIKNTKYDDIEFKLDKILEEI